MRQFFLFLALLAAGVLARPAAAANAPFIVQQPANRIVEENQSTTFAVLAGGEAPLSFEWRRNGVAISNANNATYTIPFAMVTDDGAGFSVRVANSSGAITSSVAILNVVPDSTPPTVVRVSNQPNLMQLKVRFSERVSAGTAAEASNYSLSGLSIDGASPSADGSNVTLNVSPPLVEGDSYTLSVEGIQDLAAAPNLLSPNPTAVTFQAALAPFIQTQPQSRIVAPGASVTFSVTAGGTDPKSYQWLKGQAPLAGQTGSQLVISNVQLPNLGVYRLVVSNAAGVVTSAVAFLSFFDSYTLNLPAGPSLVANQLSTTNQSFPNPPDGTAAYEWDAALQDYGVELIYFEGSGWEPHAPAVAPGKGIVLVLPIPAALTFTGVRIAPVLPVPLMSGLQLLAAQTPIRARFQDIVGSPPQEGAVVYRYKPGSPLGGAIDEIFKISVYRDGAWRDDAAIVEVGEAVFIRQLTPVTITAQPAAQTDVAAGQPASFSVTASGSPPLRYQWRLNGQNIPGATNDTHFIPAVAPGQSGLYSVSVGNLAGDVISSNAPLRLTVAGFNFTDDFGAQGTVNTFSGLLTGHNRNATMQPGEPPHGGKRTDSSVWLTWVAPTNGIMTMSAAGCSFDVLLAGYLGNTVSNLTLLDANDDDAGYGCGVVRFNARAGVPYRVCIAGLGDNQGDILLAWSLDPTTHLLPEIGTQPQDITASYGDTVQFGLNVTNAGPFNYQWHRDGVPLAGAVSPTLTLSSLTDADVGTYFVRVSNPNRFRDSAAVSLQIEVPEPGFPLSGARVTTKLFDVALPAGAVTTAKAPSKFGTVNHGYSGSQTVSSAGSGKDPGEPNHCGETGGNSIWYTVQADSAGTMFVNTDGSSFNTVLAAYVGPPVITSYSQLTNVACDNNSGLDGLDSRISFTAVSNQIYYMAVDGVGGASGTVKIAFHLVRPLVLTNLVYTNVSGGRFTMKVNGTPNLAATVQFTTNLLGGVWTTLTNYTSASGSFNFTNNNVGPGSNRLYRAVNSF